VREEREKKRVLGREIGDIFVLLVLHRRGFFERSEEEIQSTRSLLFFFFSFSFFCNFLSF